MSGILSIIFIAEAPRKIKHYSNKINSPDCEFLYAIGFLIPVISFLLWMSPLVIAIY